MNYSDFSVLNFMETFIGFKRVHCLYETTTFNHTYILLHQSFQNQALRMKNDFHLALDLK